LRWRARSRSCKCCRRSLAACGSAQRGRQGGSIVRMASAVLATLRPICMMVGTNGFPWSKRWKPGLPKVGSCQTSAVVSTSMAWRRCGQPIVDTFGVACTEVSEGNWRGANPAVAHRSRPDGKRCQASIAASKWATRDAEAPGIQATCRAGVCRTKSASGVVSSSSACW
jgi:hypothetical protein